MMTFVSLLTLRVFSSTCKQQGNDDDDDDDGDGGDDDDNESASHASLKVRF